VRERSAVSKMRETLWTFTIVTMVSAAVVIIFRLAIYGEDCLTETLCIDDLIDPGTDYR